MRVEFWQPAGEHERYASHAFDSLIGKEAPFKIEAAERGRATVVAVTVAEDGRGATWTVDIAGGTEAAKGTPVAGHLSFGPAGHLEAEPADLIQAWEWERRRK